MNKSEFKHAFALANSNADFSNVSTAHLFGCGLKDFQPVVVTLECVAAFLRWQALMFNGQWDMNELSDCEYIAKHKFNLIDGGRYTVIEGEFTQDQINGIRASARLFDSVL